MTHVPFDDLDAMERYGWQTPDQNAVPAPIIFKRDGSVSRPDRQELLWYQAVLRAIPIFAREHLRSDGQGDYFPVEASIAVPTSAGEATAVIRYPAGELDRASEPAAEMEWRDEFEGEDENEALLFDRRAMEGQLAAMARQASGEPLYADEKLQEAQELMYQAWEEQTPANASRWRTRLCPPRQTAPTLMCCWPRKRPIRWAAPSSFTNRALPRVSAL
jgi:hypothetical protein